MRGKVFLAAGGAATAAAGAALCCVAPLVAVAIGVSGAGLAGTFQPLRPYLIGATVLALGAGFRALRREERNACELGKPRADPRTRRLMWWTLWTATVVAGLLITFQYWAPLVL